MSIAPIEPIDQPELPKPSAPRRRSFGLEALFALLAAVAVTALGAPIGLLWSWVAPKVELVQTAYGPYPVEAAPEGYFADDGWFMIIGAVAGILIAVAAWIVLRRYRGPIVLAGLVVGSAAGAALAAWLGNKIGYAHYADLAANAPVDTHIFRPAKVRAGEAGLLYGVIPWVRGSLLIQAVVAAVVYTGLAGFHASPTLTYDPDPLLPDYAYHPAYAGYAFGDPQQQPGYGPQQPGYGPPPADGQPGAWSWPEGGPPAYGPAGSDQAPGGPPVNGEPREHPAQALVDLRKRDAGAGGASAAAGEPAGAEPDAAGARSDADPAPGEWRTP